MRTRGLIVTDLDGTLLDADRRVPERNLRAIRRANEAGVAVAIVTGRRLSTIRPEHAKLDGLRYRVGASNGSVILAVDNHAIESVRSLPWALVDSVVALEEAARHPVLCITTGPEPSLPPDGTPDCFVLAPRTREWMQTWRWSEPDSYRPAERAHAHALSLVHLALQVPTREEAEALEALLTPVLPAEAELHVVPTPYSAGALLEIVPRGGKAWALAYFAEILGVSAEATAAIGDEVNDLVLIDAAAHAFTVGGSVLASRRPAATEVSPAAGGAVADAIDLFLERLGA